MLTHVNRGPYVLSYLFNFVLEVEKSTGDLCSINIMVWMSIVSAHAYYVCRYLCTLTHIQSQIKPWLLFGESFALTSAG